MADEATEKEIQALYELNKKAAQECADFLKDLKARYPEFSVDAYDGYIKFAVLGLDFCMEATNIRNSSTVCWAGPKETPKNYAQLSVEKMRDRIP